MPVPTPQVVPIPISGGLSLKQDAIQTVPPKTLAANNVVFTTPESVRKRNGYAALTTAINTAAGSTQITSGSALMEYKDELLIADGTSLYSYDASGGAWINKGPLSSPYVTQQSVIRNSYTQNSQDGNTHPSGLECYTWNDSSGGARYTVIDGSTRNTVVGSTLINANATRAKVLVVGNYFVLLYYNTSTTLLYGALISVSNPKVALTPIAITKASGDDQAISSSAPNYDAAIVQTTGGPWLYVAFNSDAPGVTVYGSIGTNPVQLIGASDTVSNSATITTSAAFINVWGDLFAQGPVVGVYDNAGATVKAYCFDSQLDDPPLHTATLISGASNILKFSGISTSAAAVAFSVFVTVDTSGVGIAWQYALRQTYFVTGASYTVTGGSTPYLYGVDIEAKPFVYQGQAYITLAHQSTLQNTYFIVNSTQQVVAKLLYTLGGGFLTDASVGTPFALGDTYAANSVVTNAGSTWKVTSASTHPSITPAAFVNGTTYQTVTPGATFGVVTSPNGGYITAAQSTWTSLTSLVLVFGGTSISLTGISTASALTTAITSAAISGVAASTVGGTQTAIAFTGNIDLTGTTSITALGLAANGASSSVYKLTTVAAAPSTIGPTGGGASKDTAGNIWTFEGNSPILTASTGFVAGTTKSMDGGGTIWTYEGPVVAPMVPETTALSTTEFRSTYLIADREPTTASAIQKQLTTQSTLTGVTALACDFGNPQNSFLRAEAGGNLQISGGFIWTYDGVSPVELVFHLFPENAIYIADPMMGGNVGGTVTYAITYEWTDNNGQIQRSALSTQQLVLGITANQVFITVPNPTLTAKMSPRSPPYITIYRTTGTGTTLYFVGQVLSTYSSGQASVTFTDNTSDASLIGNALCYSQPLSTAAVPVVQNIPPDACSALAVYQNRLFALVSDDPDHLTLWYSKQVVQGQPVEFAQELTWSVDPTGGPVTAIASMDSALLVFKEARVYSLTGQGPSDNGTLNDFVLTLITTECGCVNPRSATVTPAGVMFQSPKGIYLLGRDGSATYIGADVEPYNQQTITSGQLLSNTNQVRFTLAAVPTPPASQLPLPTSLTWDTFVRQWSTFSPINAVDAAEWQGATWPAGTMVNGTDVSGQSMGPTYCYLQPSGMVMLETPGLFWDNGNWITQTITTAVLQFGKIGGFQRVWRYNLTGTQATNHHVQVQIAYDYGPVSQTSTYTPATISAYGDAPFGSGVYGGSNPPFTFNIITAQPKSTAQQLTISDMPPTVGIDSGTGEGAAWSILAALVGVLPGISRLPSGQKIG